ncbi:MAG: hypothetical protein IJK81_06495 [Selenomonadaceae bacterium]|nr:hypothetical protein [Selenomonadaceae bacterium]
MKRFLSVLMFALMLTTTARAAEFEMVEYSAQVKLQWLAAAGIPEAQKFLKLIERPVFFHADNLNDFERLEKTNALYQELNFAAAMEFVRGKNYNNIFDLACSLSPRAMILGDEGRRVVVGELQTVCLIGDWCLEEFGSKKAIKNVEYDAFWLQDRAGMMASADKFKGEICIIEQGVMIYLADDVRAQMYDNIRDVLKKHGGCMITSDFCQKKYFTDVAAALYGDAEAPTLYAETKTMYENVFGDKISDESLQDEQEAMEFLKAHGLRAVKYPLFTGTPKLYIENKLTPAQIEKINEISAKNYLWVITAI